jgi:alanyl-tRNA synthetase
MDTEITPQDGNETPEPVSEPTPTPKPDAPVAEGLDATKANELIEQKRRANAEAKAAKKEKEALQKELDAYKAAEEEKKKAEMDEVTRAKTEAEEARAAAAELQAKLDTTTRETAARDAGVLGKYADYAAQKLAKAQKADSNLKAEDFFKTFKEDNLELFNGKPPAPASGEGGPTDQARPGKYTAQIEEAKKNLEVSKDPTERIYLRRELKALEKAAAQET